MLFFRKDSVKAIGPVDINQNKKNNDFYNIYVYRFEKSS